MPSHHRFEDAQMASEANGATVSVVQFQREGGRQLAFREKKFQLQTIGIRISAGVCPCEVWKSPDQLDA